MWKKREDVIDDITVVVVFADTKLLEKSLKQKFGDCEMPIRASVYMKDGS